MLQIPPINSERFWSIVDKSKDCWEWKNSLNQSGYGVFYQNSVGYFAHRVSYFLMNGEIPIGLLVCHKCDNPKCVNPEHLFLGTSKDNMLDKVLKGRDPNQKKTHCLNGHPFIPEN